MYVHRFPCTTSQTCTKMVRLSKGGQCKGGAGGGHLGGMGPDQPQETRSKPLALALSAIHRAIGSVSSDFAGTYLSSSVGTAITWHGVRGIYSELHGF